MEHREPPHAGAEDPRPRSVAPAGPDRLALPSPGPVRKGRIGIDRTRPRMAALILLGLLVCSYLAYLGGRNAHSWLGEQPPYQVPFESIVLDPPPPAWYRGGQAGFLREVRRASRMPETIPVLGLKEDELKRAFENNSPWIEKVQRVHYRPLGVTVRPVYRRPVALVETSSHHVYLVDASGIILPHQDLDTDLGRFVKDRGLLEINGVGLSDPWDPRPGLAWQPGPGATDAVPGNELIPAAARLAGFLIEHIRSLDVTSQHALGIRYINPMDPLGRGLFLKNDEDTPILWGPAPGEEGPGSLTAEEKWEKLREWSKRGRPKPIPTDDYWEITATGLVHRPWIRTPASGSSLVRPSRRDDATIPAKRSGQ